MRLELRKFGNILSSRPAGRDAWLSAQAYLLDKIKPKEKIEVDFSGVSVLSPSWAEEFLTQLEKRYLEQVVFLPSDNPSVKASLEIVEMP
ncbi:MAG: STAS-like domain-containing protein [Candidatus Magasanikbacteria bacterium]|nr:STAS-like domain-containing protein [Candidatus Magasanikbacteria bacterium]